jgi:enoyl-[acyl-carrier protein] reductase I
VKGLIVGLANDQSLAWGCAQALHAQGMDLAITYQNDKTRTYIEPLADQVAAPIFLPLDVTRENQMDAVFAAIQERWGKLDFLLHSIAFAPKEDLQGRVTDSSGLGFATAMDVSCHSLIRLAKRAEPLMTNGGSILTMSFYGAEKVIANYNLMGPVKAALEASVRYLAYELGPKRIRVNALSTGPVKTRAASGLSHFDELMALAAERSPQGLVTLDQIGETAAFLASPAASGISGQVIYVDGGFNAIG